MADHTDDDTDDDSDTTPNAELPPDVLLARGMTLLQTMSQIHDDLFDLGTADWDADLDAGRITFTSKDKIAEADVQVIGTYNTADGTWLWGWDHPSVTPPCDAAAQTMLKYGRRHDREEITTRSIECDEDLCWNFTAMAAQLTGAQGAYRGPAGPAMVFMTYGPPSVRAIPKAERKSWLPWRR